MPFSWNLLTHRYQYNAVSVLGPIQLERFRLNLCYRQFNHKVRDLALKSERWSCSEFLLRGGLTCNKRQHGPLLVLI